MKKVMNVLLTGANGRVGQGFIKEYLKSYKDKYTLILGLHRKNQSVEGFKSRHIILEDRKSVEKGLKGIDVVIHLAANPDPQASFNDLLEPNIMGTYNIFEAAVKNKCSRVIFASSVHAIQGYGKEYEVKHSDAPKPIDLYGASKVYGEALCYVYSSKEQLSCLAIRIGAFTADNATQSICFSRQDYEHVVSQRDLAQLFHKCIMAKASVKYGILSGISNNKKKDMDLTFSKRLVGYDPVDDFHEICKK